MNNGDNDKTELAPFVVTGLPISILIIRHFVPSFVMDNYTIYLVLIAMTPWLAPWIKTLELPGGIKADFNTMHDAATQSGLLKDDGKADYLSKAKSFINIGSETKGELAKMGVELADNLGKLAALQGLPPQKDITQVIDSLSRQNIIDGNQRSLLIGVSQIFNGIIKGKSIDSRIAELALKVGPQLTTTLKELVSNPQN